MPKDDNEKKKPLQVEGTFDVSSNKAVVATDAQPINGAPKLDVTKEPDHEVVGKIPEKKNDKNVPKATVLSQFNTKDKETFAQRVQKSKQKKPGSLEP